MYAQSIYAAIAATLFASANAHFFISTPQPIPGSAVKPPLDPSGSDFPCHGVDLSAGSVTDMAVGSSQPLKFDLGDGANTAVHGGGSCQISLTYETDAAAQKDPANWKVIHSFLGGCPTNAAGNLPQAIACPGGAPDCVNQGMTFTIPPEVQNGNAILAWTWFNNIGNREMYMNCARVSISGGSGQLDKLPGMAVANIASVNSCKTTERYNTQFANPGQYVTNDDTLNYPLQAMVGSSCDGGAGSGGNTPSTGGGNSGSGGSQSPAAESPAAESPAATTTGNNGQYTPPPSSGSGNQGSQGGSGGQGGVFAPGAAAPTATQIATTFVTAPAPAATNAPASPPASSPSSGSESGPSGSCSSGQVSCSASGFYCIDANTFGMCAWGCATPMQMAAGTQCMEGAVQAKVVVPSYRKRSMRHLHARAHAVSPL